MRRTMLVCVRGRQEGKTTALLDWMCAKDKPTNEVRMGVFIRGDLAMGALRQARAEGRMVESWQFVSQHEITSHGIWSAIRGDIVVGLDDLDIMLDSGIRARWPVGFVTITGELV